LKYGGDHSGPTCTHEKSAGGWANVYIYDERDVETYTYDGDGRRVKKSSGTLYWYGAGSDPLDETDLTGVTTNSAFKEYIFFAGKRIARRDSSNNVDYYFADHLGTARIVTNATGTILDDSDFYPFGGERPVTSSSGNTYKFTGKERDPETGLDNFGARYNSSAMGRFMSVDPVTMTLGRLSDPQELNLYAYVRNNPLNHTDPTGMVIDPSGLSEKDRKKYEEARFRANQTDRNGKLANPRLHALFETLDKDKRTFHLEGGKNLGTGVAGQFDVTKRTADGKDFTDATIKLNFNLVKGSGNKGDASEYGVDFLKYSGLNKDSSRFGELAGHEFTHGLDAINDPVGAVATQDLIDKQGGGRTPLAPDEQMKLDNSLHKMENSAYSEEKKVNQELRNSEELPKQ
jgi:RHS repeat-associated protein